jgi:uncharacterized protein (TIGR00725 family)
MKNLLVIGVIGGNKKNVAELETSKRECLADDALRFGAWLALQNVHLLTGAGDGVMAGVSKGFAEQDTRAGVVLGIVPGALTGNNYRAKTGYPNRWVEIPIYTHLSGSDPKGFDSRNHINVLTSDLMIAFPGGSGTRAELELARDYDKPAIAFVRSGFSIGGRSAEMLIEEGFIVKSELDSLRAAVDLYLNRGPRPFAVLDS